MTQAAPSDLIASATVVLLRDGMDGPEVFLVRRHAESGFMANATVFPGGKVDQADDGAAADGLDAAACAARLGGLEPRAARALHIAAVRELHEESHILLARDRAGRLPNEAEVAEIDARLEALRDGHRLAGADYHRVLAEAQLTPALDLLVPFAHWVTPSAQQRRFDTWFFAAALPPQQRAALDIHETTAAGWSTPRAALQEHAAGGEIHLPPPTQHTLHRFAGLGTSSRQVLGALALGGPGPRIQPHHVKEPPDGPAIVLPDDPAHPDHEAWIAQHAKPARRHRFAWVAGRFVYLG